MKQDGSVSAWGWEASGASSVAGFTSGVEAVFANDNAFVAQKSDGTLVSWGKGVSSSGFTLSGMVQFVTSSVQFSTVAAKVESAIEFIQATDSAFAAKHVNGSVVTWGLKHRGRSNFIRGGHGPLLHANFNDVHVGDAHFGNAHDINDNDYYGDKYFVDLDYVIVDAHDVHFHHIADTTQTSTKTLLTGTTLIATVTTATVTSTSMTTTTSTVTEHKEPRQGLR
ncbi:unnamed protein product [Symbiodinium sp. CCMP2592]|nr:unnamed protein product [Symbiodinium sp. CCMP2592]